VYHGLNIKLRQSISTNTSTVHLQAWRRWVLTALMDTHCTV